MTMDKKGQQENRYVTDCERELGEVFDIEYYKAIFDPVRIELIKYLAIHGAKNVGEIADNFTQDRSVISRHLDIMCKQGILKKKKESRYMIYEVECWSIIEKFEETARNLRRMVEEER